MLSENLKEIILKQMTEEQARTIFQDLAQEDEKFKEISQLFEPPKEQPLLAKIAFILIVIIHFAIIIINVISIPLILFKCPFYLSIPIISLLVNLLNNNTSGNFLCPLTKLESYIRKILGKNEINFFIQHYIVNPVQKYLNK